MDAEALKAWRGRMSMSQQEAADALSCSLATIQSAETGRRPVAPMMALACEALEMRRQHKGDDDTAGGLDAIRERLAALEELSPASVEARLNTIEQRLLPDADRAFVLRWHAAWLARQPLPAATINKAVKAWQADDDMTEEEHEAAKAKARAAFASEDKAPYQPPSEDEIQRQIRQGMIEQREREKLERAKKQQAEEMAAIARRAARSVLPD